MPVLFTSTFAGEPVYFTLLAPEASARNSSFTCSSIAEAPLASTEDFRVCNPNACNCEAPETSACNSPVSPAIVAIAVPLRSISISVQVMRTTCASDIPESERSNSADRTSSIMIFVIPEASTSSKAGVVISSTISSCFFISFPLGRSSEIEIASSECFTFKCSTSSAGP